MITLFGIITISLLVYMVFKKLNNKYQERMFKNKMAELRDDLAQLAFEKKVDINSREYNYLYSSICKAKENSYFITLFYVASLDVKHDHHYNNLETYRKSYEALIEGIYADYHLKQAMLKKNKYVKNYLFSQSPFLFFVAKLIKNIFNFKRFIQKKLNEINYLPELSGINHCF